MFLVSGSETKDRAERSKQKRALKELGLNGYRQAIKTGQELWMWHPTALTPDSNYPCTLTASTVDWLREALNKSMKVGDSIALGDIEERLEDLKSGVALELPSELGEAPTAEASTKPAK